MDELKAIIRQANQALLAGIADGTFTEQQVAAEMARQAGGWQQRVPKTRPAGQAGADLAWAQMLANRRS
jgi:hypothetical protein